FVISAIAAEGADLEDLKRAVLEEVEAYVQDGPTPEELARAKAQLEAGFLQRMESLPSRADRINMYRHYYGVSDAFEQDLARWTDPTAEDVRGWAQRVFGPGRVDMRVYPEGTADTAALDERPEPMPVGEFRPPVARTFELSNGIRVHAIPRPGTRLFSGRLVARGGENGIPDAQAGLAELTARVMNSGAGGLSAAEFANSVETAGAGVWVSAGRSAMTAVVSGISSRMDDALDRFADIVLEPNLADADFDREKDLALGAIRSREDDPGSLSQAVGRALLFDGSDPRHRPFSGREETVSALTVQQVREVVPRMFHPDAATFTFVGDFEVEALQKALEKRFRGWKGRGEPLPAPAVVPRESAPRFVLVDRPEAPQTVVYASRIVPMAEGVERAVRDAALTVFGGTFTSRVNGNLREENGFTYGAFSVIAERPDHHLLFVSTDVFTDVTGKALLELRGECQGMVTDPPSDEEAQKGLEALRTELIDTAQTTGSLAATLADIVAVGRPLDAVSRDLEALDRVTADAVRDFATTGYLDWGDLTVVLVGDREAVLTQLREEGFDLPEIVDADGRPLGAESASVAEPEGT
ncbi:MAG TPA: insulinase family protein, partial [bacterium]|nr:insulinase family protein [bacterium]